jgi:hypothetical protein
MKKFGHFLSLSLLFFGLVLLIVLMVVEWMANG